MTNFTETRQKRETFVQDNTSNNLTNHPVTDFNSESPIEETNSEQMNTEDDLSPEQKHQLKIQKLQEKLKLEKKKLRDLEKKKNAEERKARSKRLIEVGAILESYFEIFGPEEAEQIGIQFGNFIKEKKQINPNYVLIKNRQ